MKNQSCLGRVGLSTLLAFSCATGMVIATENLYSALPTYTLIGVATLIGPQSFIEMAKTLLTTDPNPYKA